VTKYYLVSTEEEAHQRRVAQHKKGVEDYKRKKKISATSTSSARGSRGNNPTEIPKTSPGRRPKGEKRDGRDRRQHNMRPESFSDTRKRSAPEAKKKRGTRKKKMEFQFGTNLLYRAIANDRLNHRECPETGGTTRVVWYFFDRNPWERKKDLHESSSPLSDG